MLKENGKDEYPETAEVLRELDENAAPTLSINRISNILLELLNYYNNASNSGMSQVAVVKELINICKGSLFVASSRKSKTLRTPYQLRVAELRIVWNMLVTLFYPFIQDHPTISDESGEDAFRSVVMEDPIASTIRSYCLHNFNRDEITKCLYHPGQELHIDFDLAGLPSPTISKAFLDRLSKHLRFESILKYVALPRLAMELPSAAGGSVESTRARHRGQRGRVDLKQIFQWLRDRKVKSIIKVIVIEDETRPHTDTAIEEAVRGFNVEIWDWKKPDLCTDVIANSSSVVKQISLYSSGNNAVLMGWASSFGLADHVKFPKARDHSALEYVNLFIREGQEGDERRMEHLKDFMERLDKRPNAEGNPIHVDYILDDGEVSYAANFENSEGCLPSDNWWIKDLQEFALLTLQIQTEEKTTYTAPVKIAIIDDGVDGSLDLLTGKIAGGKSFCPYPNSNDLMNAYYVPSGFHGTMMAQLICKICPTAMLYIARLDERFSRDGGRHITASSAAEAIRWAVSCDVDIISMSWTIETLQPDEDITKLGDEIQAAAAKHILMFCAASDQGSISSDHCYPGKWVQCIKIGAATDNGDKCAWVPDNHYEFLFPGKNLPVSHTQVDGLTTSFESGSSLSTALAPGLAGLLLFCDRVVTRPAASHGQSGVEFLRRRENMTDVFKRMGTPRVFPRVDTWFKNTFEGMLNENSGEGANDVKLDISKVHWSDNTRRALEKLMAKLKNQAG